MNEPRDNDKAQNTMLLIASLMIGVATATECVRMVTLAAGNKVQTNFSPEQHANLLCVGTFEDDCSQVCTVVDCGQGCMRGLLETLPLEQVLSIDGFYITHPHLDHFADLTDIENWWPVQHMFAQRLAGKTPPFAIPPIRYIANLQTNDTLANLQRAFATDESYRTHPWIFDPIRDLYNSSMTLQKLSYGHNGSFSAWEIARSHFANAGNVPSSAFAFQFPWMTIAFTGDGAFQWSIDGLLEADASKGFERNVDVLVANSRPARGASQTHMSANEVAVFTERHAVGELIFTHGLPVASDPNPPFPLLPMATEEEYRAGAWDGGYFGSSVVTDKLRDHRWANMRIESIWAGAHDAAFATFQNVIPGTNVTSSDFALFSLQPVFDNSTQVEAIDHVQWTVTQHGINFSTSTTNIRDTTDDGRLRFKKVADQMDGTWSITAIPCSDSTYDDPATGEQNLCGIPFTVTAHIEFH